MRIFACCCEWRFVVGRKKVYGPLFTGPAADWHIGTMMTRAEFADLYGDCNACLTGRHRHPR